MTREVCFRPGWLQRQVAKSADSINELPPKIRAALHVGGPMTQPPPDDALTQFTQMAAAAVALRQLYQSYVDAGFSPDQAMKIIIGIMQAGLK